MAQATGLPVGYSDHSQGVEAALAAVALGAALIEKHLTLDKALPGPDHLASADPQEFAAMVRGIRLVEAMRGDGVKQPTAVEANTRDVARRSVALAAARPRGHVRTAADLVLRRPAGAWPSMWRQTPPSIGICWKAPERCARSCISPALGRISA